MVNQFIQMKNYEKICITLKHNYNNQILFEIHKHKINYKQLKRK